MTSNNQNQLECVQYCRYSLSKCKQRVISNILNWNFNTLPQKLQTFEKKYLNTKPEPIISKQSTPRHTNSNQSHRKFLIRKFQSYQQLVAPHSSQSQRKLSESQSFFCVKCKTISHSIKNQFLVLEIVKINSFWVCENQAVQTNKCGTITKTSSTCVGRKFLISWFVFVNFFLRWVFFLLISFRTEKRILEILRKFQCSR